jgi:acetolactate synthase-1/2/3 large subunit
MGSDTGGSLVVTTLESCGVRYVFGVCGDHVNHIFDALNESSVELVDMRDERSAGFAAEGWALCTADPGVAIVTAGPGVANIVPALAECHAWGVPIVVIAGCGPDSAHEHLVAGVTKRTQTVREAERIPEVIERAMHEARDGRPGPVFVDIPMDVQSRRIDPSAAVHHAPAARSRTREACRIEQPATRPVLIGGSGVWWARAGGQLRAFAERASVPVFLKGAARGMLPEDHELSFGLPNPLLGPASLALAEADVFIVVGTRMDVHLANGSFIGDRPVVHVDIEPAVGHYTCDASEFLAGLTGTIPSYDSDQWIATLTDARRTHERTLDERAASGAGDGVHPARLLGEIRTLAGPDTTIVVDAGELGLYAYEMLPAYAPGSLLIGINSPLAGLGQGVPFAIAAALAYPERRTILLSGDGALGFGALDLHTAARRHLPVDVVVGNDGEWGIIAHVQDVLHGRRTGTSIGGADYAALGRALGCDGERVETPDRLRAVLGVPPRSTPRLLDVKLSRAAVHPLCDVIASMF